MVVTRIKSIQRQCKTKQKERFRMMYSYIHNDISMSDSDKYTLNDAFNFKNLPLSKISVQFITIHNYIPRDISN